MIDFSIVIPAYNEAKNLKILLPRLRSYLNDEDISYEIIVVDNASTDNTQDILKEIGNSIPRIVKVFEPVLGYGCAILKGLKKTKGDYLCIVDADNQARLADLVKMIRYCKKGNIEFYKAVRKDRKSDGFFRLLVSSTYNLALRYLFSIKLKDINAKPKIFTRSYYNNAKLVSKDWFIDAEMLIKAHRLGYKINSIEIEHLPRLEGKSTVKLKHSFGLFKTMLACYKNQKSENYKQI